MQRQLTGQVSQWYKCTLILCLGFLISACQSLPPRMPVASSHYLTNTEDTALGQLLTPYKDQNPELTGYQVLIDPINAIAARLILIDKAQKSLDLQYYIWHNDKVGALTLQALLRAADRGVRVRLLLDDNNTADMDATLLALTEHPNIEVRLFNPFMYRKWRSLNYIFDLKRNNRRMHNKTFLADTQVALIGGRNISNQYYDAGETFQFSDIDVLLVGKTVPEVAQSFDDYWNYHMAYPAQQIIKRQNHLLTLNQLRQQLKDFQASSSAQEYLDLAREQIEFNQWLNQTPKLDWVTAHLVYDSPEKVDRHTRRDEHLTFQLQNLVGAPQYQLDVISAYFVPADEGTEALIKLKRRGARVRALTNSYAANDVPIVHAFYAKRRKELLENGIELYEFLPQLKTVKKRYFRKDRVRIFTDSKSVQSPGIGDSSDASLHAKMMLFDNRQVFIGSFNFDPRSANLNTEIGVILDSPTLARQVSRDLDQHLLNIAYRVRLDDRGNIIWEEKTTDGIKVYTREPNIAPLKRFSLKMLAVLPLDGFM